MNGALEHLYGLHANIRATSQDTRQIVCYTNFLIVIPVIFSIPVIPVISLIPVIFLFIPHSFATIQLVRTA